MTFSDSSDDEDNDLLNYQPFSQTPENETPLNSNAKTSKSDSSSIEAPNLSETKADPLLSCEDDEIEELAKIRLNAHSMLAYRSLSSPKDLYWCYDRGSYWPCRLIHNKGEVKGLDMELEKLNEEKQCIVQFFCEPWMDLFYIANKSDIKPYDTAFKQNTPSIKKLAKKLHLADYDGWSPIQLARYESIQKAWYKKEHKRKVKRSQKKRRGSSVKSPPSLQTNDNERIYAESNTKFSILLLTKILETAREREAMTKKEEVENKKEAEVEQLISQMYDDEDDNLEEPYAQNLEADVFEGVPVDESKAREPLRAGDVIEYFSPMFVAGNKRGMRVATVIKVDPDHDPLLKLDNQEVLPKTTHISRKKTLNKDGKLEDLPFPVTRPIERFKLKKSTLSKDKYTTESERMGKVINKTLDNMDKKMQEEGFGAMDGMFNKFKNVKNRPLDSDLHSRELNETTSASKRRSKQKPISRKRTKTPSPETLSKANSSISSDDEAGSNNSEDLENGLSNVNRKTDSARGGHQGSVLEWKTIASKSNKAKAAQDSNDLSDSEDEMVFDEPQSKQEIKNKKKKSAKGLYKANYSDVDDFESSSEDEQDSRREKSKYRSKIGSLAEGGNERLKSGKYFDKNNSRISKSNKNKAIRTGKTNKKGRHFSSCFFSST